MEELERRHLFSSTFNYSMKHIWITFTAILALINSCHCLDLKCNRPKHTEMYESVQNADEYFKGYYENY
uniref:Uncharacterized protein n=1 Tax=Glossina palpalis gambiensis TaxID=67801 RepID=A0A1B0BMN1_9MUSC